MSRCGLEVKHKAAADAQDSHHRDSMRDLTLGHARLPVAH